MKKLLCLVLALTMLLALCACGETAADDAAASDTETAETAETAADDAAADDAAPVDFIVGFDATFPPFGFTNDDGSYDGYDLALAKEACTRLGWNYSEIAIDWDAKDAELASGTITCIWNGFTYNGREEDYTWTTPYYDSSIVVVVKADSGITSLADLAGKSVMVQAGSSGLSALEADTELTGSFAELIEEPSYATGFMELDQGTVQAVVADTGVAKYNIGEDTDKYVILDEEISVEQYAVGFLKGNTEMRDQLQAVLDEMAADGTMYKIAQDYEQYDLVLTSLCMCPENQ